MKIDHSRKAGHPTPKRWDASIGRRLLGIGCWAIVSLFISGCHPPPDSTSPTARLGPSLVSGNRAFEAVTQLVAITPRHAGSPGAAKAAEHLKAALAPYTSSCEINSFDDETPHGTVTFRNVIGVTPGNGNDLIIFQHGKNWEKTHPAHTAKTLGNSG